MKEYTMKIAMLYYSKTGHTLEAVSATAEGIRSAGGEVDIISVSDFSSATISNYDGLIVASPCRAGSVTSSGVAKAVVRALDSLPPDCLKGKRCGGISVHAKAGGETTVDTLGRLLFQRGCEEYTPGPVAKAGVPFSVWKGPSVGVQDEARFKGYGAEFVEQGKGSSQGIGR